jgi:hypothetical protein
MRDFYLFVHSEDSIEYFSDNKPGSFRVKLKNPIYLDGNKWHVGLCEIKGLLWDVGANDTVYIFCSLPNGLLMPSNREGLLRAMAIQTPAECYVEYNKVIYTAIQTHFIDVIEFSLKVNTFDTPLIGKKASSGSSDSRAGSTWCLLHFKQTK